MRAGGALVAAALLLVACGGDGTAERADPGGPARSSTSTSTATSEPAVPDRRPAIAWSSCGGEAECATVAVPRDHDDPDGPTVDLAVLRLPARGERLGSLFVNFGGPGSSAVEGTPTFPWPDRIRERFDIVAVDPRGVGGSTPLGCGVPAAELYAVDHSIEDADDAQALTAVSAAYATDCERERGRFLPHVGTWDVARDLDLVRAGLGDEQLSFLGYSYGTSIGQAYAELFPDRVRAMVLDGVVDPANPGVDTAVQQAVGFEVALGRWADACADRPSCPSGTPVAAVEQALAAAEAGVPAGDRSLGPGHAVIGMAMALYAEGLWPALDAAVAAAVAGDGAPLLALADQYATLVEFPAYFAVSCLDSSWPADAAAHLAAAEEATARAPHFGEALVNDYLPCALWPADPDPIGAVDAAGAPPILLVSTTGDPATPHAGAQAVADRLASGVLVAHEGDGHTVVFQGDACVDDLVVPYLVDLAVPEAGARCSHPRG